MNRTAFKFIASTMIVSLTMVTATAQSVAMRRGSPERADSQIFQRFDGAAHVPRAIPVVAADP